MGWFRGCFEGFRGVFLGWITADQRCLAVVWLGEGDVWAVWGRCLTMFEGSKPVSNGFESSRRHEMAGHDPHDHHHDRPVALDVWPKTARKPPLDAEFACRAPWNCSPAAPPRRRRGRLSDPGGPIECKSPYLRAPRVYVQGSESAPLERARGCFSTERGCFGQFVGLKALKLALRPSPLGGFAWAEDLKVVSTGCVEAFSMRQRDIYRGDPPVQPTLARRLL